MQTRICITKWLAGFVLIVNYVAEDIKISEIIEAKTHA